MYIQEFTCYYLVWSGADFFWNESKVCTPRLLSVYCTHVLLNMSTTNSWCIQPVRERMHLPFLASTHRSSFTAKLEIISKRIAISSFLLGVTVMIHSDVAARSEINLSAIEKSADQTARFFIYYIPCHLSLKIFSLSHPSLSLLIHR